MRLCQGYQGEVSGRLGGAEIARVPNGTVKVAFPAHLRADIDYATL